MEAICVSVAKLRSSDRACRKVRIEVVQVATLLTVIGEEAREVYSTFSGWENDEDQNKIQPVLNKFAAYCQTPCAV